MTHSRSAWHATPRDVAAVEMTDRQRELASDHIRIAYAMGRRYGAAYPRLHDEMESRAIWALVGASLAYPDDCETPFPIYAWRRIRSALGSVAHRDRTPTPFGSLYWAPNRGDGPSVEDRDFVRACLESLPAELEPMARLVWQEGLSTEDAGLRLGISRSKAFCHVHRAIHLLRKQYA